MKMYAENASIIPNSSDALSYVADKYGVDCNKDVTLCGQIRFSDTYNAFTPIAAGLKNVIKCSAQKYMINLNENENGDIQYEKDENGNEYLLLGNGETKITKEYVGQKDESISGYAFCKMQYFLDTLENDFMKYREE